MSCWWHSPEFSESDEHSLHIETGIETFSYHNHVKYKLTAQEEQAREEMLNWFNDKTEEEDRIDNDWLSGEETFQLAGYVNSNCVFWAIEPL